MRGDWTFGGESRTNSPATKSRRRCGWDRWGSEWQYIWLCHIPFGLLGLLMTFYFMLFSSRRASCQSVKLSSVVDVTVSLNSQFDKLIFAYGFKIDTFRSLNITWGEVSFTRVT